MGKLSQWVSCILGVRVKGVVAAVCFEMPLALAGWEGFLLGVWPALM